MRLLVLGGGPAGATAAAQARELGADVTLLEAEQVGGTNLNHGPAPVRTLARAARLARDWSSWERFGLEGPRPVPNLDAVLANCARVARYAHISAALGRAFEARGIEVITGASVQALERDGEQVIVGLTRGGPAERVITGAVFAAVGWPANVKDLDLDAAGVASDPRAIGADDYLKTNVGHIFAAGDVNGRAKLVQFARLEGRIAAWNAVHGPTRRLGYDVVPSGSFTNPEYGSVGLTEDQAAAHHDIAVGIAWYDDLLRPVADGRPDGFCKLIADRHSHALLGAHVLGDYSAEIVQVVATAIRAGMNVEQLAEMQFAFPTFTEAVSMAAQKACRAIGIGKFPPAWSYLGRPE